MPVSVHCWILLTCYTSALHRPACGRWIFVRFIHFYLFIPVFRANLYRCRHGTEDVNSTWAAARPVWKVLQILFESQLFAKYPSREYVHFYEKKSSVLTYFRLIFATESYGGHYGPKFVVHFDEQNTKIDKGIIQGEKINISALMINK